MPLDLTLPIPGTFTPGSLKHAPIGAPAPRTGDVRSVGELLIDADYHARTLLLDAEATAAPGLLRSWVDTVASAVDLWNSFPGRDYAGPDAHRTIERVTELATSIRADLATARWPGTGASDHRMHAIDDNLTRARELVDKYGDELQPHVTRVHKDLEAARTRVVHTLYIATHGVGVALSEDGRQRAANPSRVEALRAATSYRGRYEVGPGVRWADRLGVVERVLGCYLRPGRYAEALAHEQAAPAVGLPRLREALARFDIQTHRTLVEAPNPGNLVLATRTQGMFFGAALVLARAAAETGHVDPAGVDPARLEQVLTAAGEAWMSLGRRWRDLMHPGSRLDPALSAAAGQLRAACRELTHDGDRLASQARVAQRVDLAAAMPVIAQYVDAAAELAQATRPALRDPDLSAPTRAVVRRLVQDIEDGIIPENCNALDSGLISIAVRKNRLGPVPDDLLDSLDSSAADAASTSHAAASLLTTCLVRAERTSTVATDVQPSRSATPTPPAATIFDSSLPDRLLRRGPSL